MELLIFVLVMVLIFSKKARATVKRWHGKLVKLVMKTGLNYKVSKFLVNLLLFIFAVKIIF